MEGSDSVNRRLILCRNCERPGYALVTGVAKDESKRPGLLSVNFTKLEELAGRENFPDDLRFFGLQNKITDLNQEFTQQQAVLNLLKHEDWMKTVAGRNGTRRTTISRSGPKNFSLSIIFAEELADQPIEYHLTEYTRLTLSKLDYADVGNGRFYPKFILNTVSYDGVLSESSTITISKHDFANPPSPDKFTLAGLGLEEGQVVAYPEIKNEGDYPVWRNGQLDAVNTANERSRRLKSLKAEEQSPVAFPDQRRSPLLYVLGGIAALTSSVVVAVAYRKRKRN